MENKLRLEVFNIRIYPYIETHYVSDYVRNGKAFKRRLKLKEPKAHYNSTFEIKVYGSFKLGDVYQDEFKQKFVCVSRINLDTPVSFLKPVKQFEKDILNLSTRLVFVSSRIGED